ncbi:MAG: alpha/beta fold hydrolase, partial [Pseudomonadota bacterium]
MKRVKAFCDTPFGQVFYWTTGSGPPLLLLHQASQSSEECLQLAASLNDQYTVISLDYPGHGVSDDPARELQVPDYCAAIIAVLDELQIDKLHVCGHHSGGILAIYLALNHAERVQSIVLSGIGVRTEAGVRAVLDTPMTRDLPIDSAGDFLPKTWGVYRR